MVSLPPHSSGRILEVSKSKLKGIVKMMDAVGGKQRSVSSGNLDNKTMVLGAVERGGTIRLKVERRKESEPQGAPCLHKRPRTATERLITDENPAYFGIADDDTTHETVNHRAEEWVRDLCLRTPSRMWSLFKRGIVRLLSSNQRKASAILHQRI